MNETPEEYKARARSVIENQTFEINQGGCEHDISVVRQIGLPGYERSIEPVVSMCNDDDPYYCKYFRSRGEINKFIQELERARDEAWPTSSSVN